MTLDEAIAHCLEVAEKNEISAITYKNCKEIKTNMYEKLTAEKAENDCRECAADHRQLAEWLQDYKMLRGEYDNCQLNSIEDYRRETARCRSAYFKVNSELCHMKISLSEYHKEFAEFKRLLKAAVEDFRILGTMLEDGHGHCTAEISCDECVLGGGNLADDCQWRHEAEVLKLIEEEEE